MSFLIELESIEVEMSGDECNALDDFCYSSSSSEENIFNGGRFEEAVLTTISSVVGEMFDKMFSNEQEDSFTTPKRHAFTLDYVTVRVSN